VPTSGSFAALGATAAGLLALFSVACQGNGAAGDQATVGMDALRSQGSCPIEGVPVEAERLERRLWGPDQYQIPVPNPDSVAKAANGPVAELVDENR
jgi:hypothetical protein